jgi:hypothetical protein
MTSTGWSSTTAYQAQRAGCALPMSGIGARRQATATILTSRERRLTGTRPQGNLRRDGWNLPINKGIFAGAGASDLAVRHRESQFLWGGSHVR